MVGCNENVTIYNKYIENRKERWKRTVISGVSWYGKQEISISKDGLTSADVVIIRIPANVTGYVPHADWMQGRTGWTVQKGDVVIRGSCNIDIGIDESISKVLTAEEKTTVLSVSNNRRGALGHIRIGGG